jgi:hypothetical protein
VAHFSSMIARPAPNSGSGFLRRNLRLLDDTYAIAATFSGCHNAWQHGGGAWDGVDGVERAFVSLAVASFIDWLAVWQRF